MKQKNLEWHSETFGPWTWQEAQDHINKMGNGWRLPTVKELIHEFSYKKGKSKERNGPWKQSWYWSSTSHAYYSTDTWYVSFDNGNVNNNDKSNSYYVRCVRLGP